ncbi:hypothetical protein PMIN06_009192 [Paraphaeosphaeria minitans]
MACRAAVLSLPYVARLACSQEAARWVGGYVRGWRAARRAAKDGAQKSGRLKRRAPFSLADKETPEEGEDAGGEGAGEDAGGEEQTLEEQTREGESRRWKSRRGRADAGQAEAGGHGHGGLR